MPQGSPTPYTKMSRAANHALSCSAAPLPGTGVDFAYESASADESGVELTPGRVSARPTGRRSFASVMLNGFFSKIMLFLLKLYFF